MSASRWFDDVPVLGKLLPRHAAAKLREVGEHDAAAALDAARKAARGSRGRPAGGPAGRLDEP
jgi:hypothetical protein